jgi:hypothetical protein
MKIRIERLEIEVPGFMEGLGEIVLGDAQAEWQTGLAAERDKANHIWSYAQAALKLVGEYLKVHTNTSDDAAERVEGPPPEEPPGQ